MLSGQQLERGAPRAVLFPTGDDKHETMEENLSSSKSCTGLRRFWSWLSGAPPSSYTMQQKCSYIVYASPLGGIWEGLQIAFSIIGCAAYVVYTYSGDQEWMLEQSLAVFFMADLVFRWYIDHNRWTYLVSSPMPAVDVLVILPTIAEWAADPKSPYFFFLSETCALCGSCTLGGSCTLFGFHDANRNCTHYMSLAPYATLRRISENPSDFAHPPLISHCK